jgi:hypothetical protein
MQKVIMYKYFNPDPLFGGYGWSIEEILYDRNSIYSNPYYVEIPDNFHIGESVTGEKMYFKDGCDHGYKLEIENRYSENSRPCLIGGNPTEVIKLNVIGIVQEE